MNIHTWKVKNSPALKGDNVTHCLVRAGTHSELGALTGQVGEQVGGGRQTSCCHGGVGRVRQLMETPDSLQTACSIRAREETNQKMHTILLPGGNKGL